MSSRKLSKEERDFENSIVEKFSRQASHRGTANHRTMASEDGMRTSRTRRTSSGRSTSRSPRRTSSGRNRSGSSSLTAQEENLRKRFDEFIKNYKNSDMEDHCHSEVCGGGVGTHFYDDDYGYSKIHCKSEQPCHSTPKCHTACEPTCPPKCDSYHKDKVVVRKTTEKKTICVPEPKRTVCACKPRCKTTCMLAQPQHHAAEQTTLILREETSPSMMQTTESYHPSLSMHSKRVKPRYYTTEPTLVGSLGYARRQENAAKEEDRLKDNITRSESRSRERLRGTKKGEGQQRPVTRRRSLGRTGDLEKKRAEVAKMRAELDARKKAKSLSQGQSTIDVSSKHESHHSYDDSSSEESYDGHHSSYGRHHSPPRRRSASRQYPRQKSPTRRY